MGRFTRIPQNTFERLQLNAGILLKKFDPTGATPVAEEDIICATTGGINVSCVPSYSDFGEDVDNCPANMMELKHLDSWECKLGFTSLGTSPASIRLALGAADITGEGRTKIVPRRDLKQTDFSDVWWVGDRADGGMVAAQLKNALSAGGFSLQTSKNGKGQISVELMGHVSMADQTTMPMEFYSSAPGAAQVPDQSKNLLGKRISELITPETAVGADGKVTGTLHYVTGYTGFSSKKEEQQGNYFPAELLVTGEKMTLKKNGAAAPGKENLAFDPELLFRVTGQNDVFTVEVDGEEAARFDFSGAVLEPAESEGSK